MFEGWKKSNVRGYVDATEKVESFRKHIFFQAEDGIRDIGVTGVQTCALPISRTTVLRPCRTAPGPRTWRSRRPVPVQDPRRDRGQRSSSARPDRGRGRRATVGPGSRSEERRVGKECRSRGSPYHYKKTGCDSH